MAHACGVWGRRVTVCGLDGRTPTGRCLCHRVILTVNLRTEVGEAKAFCRRTGRPCRECLMCERMKAQQPTRGALCPQFTDKEPEAQRNHSSVTHYRSLHTRVKAGRGQVGGGRVWLHTGAEMAQWGVTEDPRGLGESPWGQRVGP